MLNWFKKDPVAALEKQYEKLLVEARDLQRNGDIIAYADKTAESEQVLQKIDELRAAS
jgi:hypothetical protein